MADQVMDLITQPENLLEAWRAVRGNVPRQRRGQSAGPDGVTLREYEQDLEMQLNTLREMLVTDRYVPEPPKVVRLAKRQGGQRTIGVLNVRDRVAQRATGQVLGPLWEPNFLACSFGFRPGRGTPHALAEVQTWRDRGCGWAVKGDIQDCFGSLDHDRLLRLCGQRVADRRVVALITRWLDAGALTAGWPTGEGTSGASEAPAGWGRMAQGVKQGAGWVLEAVLPGATTGVEYGRSLGWMPMGPPKAKALPAGEAEADDPREVGADEWEAVAQQEALRRMTVAALAAGAAWLRPNMGQVVYRAGQVLRSPAGRRVLRAGGWWTLGLAGAAAVGAVTALAMHQYAGPSPRGIVQGSPLSPLMANVYLHAFDKSLCQRGYHLVRYADDFVVLAENQEQAEGAFNTTVRTLRQIKLTVSREKVRLAGPGEHWEFLGREF